MRHPDDVARLREVKRLLERIQSLPRLAGVPGNGLAGGFQAGPPHPSEELEPEALEPDLEPEPYEPYEPCEPYEPHDEPVRPPPLPSFMPSLEIPADERTQRTHREHWQETRALVPVQPGVGPGISPWVFITATAVNTIVAAVLAVVITLGVARRDPAPAEAEKLTAASWPSAPPRSEPALPAPVELLPIGSPDAPLRLQALKPTRLPLQVQPAEAVQDSYILLLSGLPAKAVLTGASRMGADSWLVSPGALQRLDLMVPEWSDSVAEVDVELRRTNGAVVAQSRLWLAVPPPPVPVRAKLDKTGLEELVRDGDRLLSHGNVAAARALYERAAAMGSAQAALAMGSTYDPHRLWSLGVFGMVGDKTRAQRWYTRAARLGHPDARARIAALREP